jgi:hypothetical protein
MFFIIEMSLSFYFRERFRENTWFSRKFSRKVLVSRFRWLPQKTNWFQATQGRVVRKGCLKNIFKQKMSLKIPQFFFNLGVFNKYAIVYAFICYAVRSGGVLALYYPLAVGLVVVLKQLGGGLNNLFCLRYFFSPILCPVFDTVSEYRKWTFVIRYTIFRYFLSPIFRYFFTVSDKYRISKYRYLYRKCPALDISVSLTRGSWSCCL